MEKNEATLKAVSAAAHEMKARGWTYLECVSAHATPVAGCWGFQFTATNEDGGYFTVWAYTRGNGEVGVY